MHATEAPCPPALRSEHTRSLRTLQRVTLNKRLTLMRPRLSPNYLTTEILFHIVS